MDKLINNDKNNSNLTPFQKIYGRLFSFGQKNINSKKLIRRNSSIDFTSISENDKTISNEVNHDKSTFYGGLKSLFAKEMIEIEKEHLNEDKLECLRKPYANKKSLELAISIQDKEKESNDLLKSLRRDSNTNSKKKEIIKLKNLLTGLSDVDFLHHNAISVSKI
jgi:predicted transcriptional regulator